MIQHLMSVNETNILFAVGGTQQDGSNYTPSTHYLSR